MDTGTKGEEYNKRTLEGKAQTQRERTGRGELHVEMYGP